MKRGFALPAVLAAIAGAGQASAADPGELEEIIVTAQRREEPLRQVAVSAAVLSAEQLEQYQVKDLDGLQQVTPNLVNVPINVTRTGLSFSLRGQHQLENAISVDPVVATYLDEVYLGRIVGANLATIDLERVELLRGPQGILFGRNASAGALNVVSRKPGTSRDVRLGITLGNYQRRELDGALNLPWDDGAQALRLTAAIRERDGFARTPEGQALDDEGLRFLRVQYRWSMRPGWNLNLAVDGSQGRTNAERRTLLAVSADEDDLPADFGIPEDRLSRYVDPFARIIPADDAGSIRTDAWGAAAVFTATLGGLELKSISSFRRLDSAADGLDGDATPYEISRNRFRLDRQHQWSQEMQLSGTAVDDKLRWIGGVYGFREAGGFWQAVRSYAPATRTWSENLPGGQARNTAAAAYLQAEYTIAPRWRLAAGARYNRDGRQLTSYNAFIQNDEMRCRLSPAIRDEPGTCRATLPERSFEYVPWMLSLAWQADAAAMLYLKLSRGFHAGGYNLRGVGVQDLTTFGPERATTLEWGAHMDWPSRRLRINAALFHTRVDDFLVSTRTPAIPGLSSPSVLENGGRTRIVGGELEAQARLGPLGLSLALGVTKGEFTRLAPFTQEIALDSHFVQTPRHSASLALKLPLRIGALPLQLHADYGWRDDIWFRYEPDTLARQRAFGLLNLTVRTDLPDSRLDFSLWARNLANTRYLVQAFDNSYFYSAIPGNPRTVGVSLAWRLGESR